MSNWYRFKVIGFLRAGTLKVEPIPPLAPKGAVMLFDLFIDELPLELVSPHLRIPNSIVWGRVEADNSVSEVSETVSAKDGKHYA
ncbi:hypothetical protein [Xanthomonas pisi]|uniref:hypothetical protein n=1 Tax=Xanthomonas pisi TaxID=56457 RepID=UPI0006578BB7|nr:hypothetical protein [Xanthomonas pisi]KLD70682.1 hypothetical protein Y887_10480 [Xanthomonas pisi DSM 18956]